MKLIELYILIFLGTLLFTGCEFNELGDGEFTSNEKRTLTASSYDIVLDTELEQCIHVEGNNPWEIKNVPDWLSIMPLNGQNEDVRIVAEANPSSETDRAATIEVVSSFIKKEIKITQKKSDGILNVSPLTFGFGPEGGKDNLHIDCNGKWIVKTNNNWCHLSKTSGTGNAIIELTCDANNSNGERIDTIYVSNALGLNTKKIPVIQSSTDFYIIPGIKNFEFNGQGETIKFQLLSNVKWNITASHSWCQVSPIGGNGDQEISVTLGRNPTASPRNAKLTITSTTSGVSPVEVNITQYKGEDPRLTIDSNSANFSNKGGTKTITVNSNINWYVEYTSDWFYATPTESTFGDGTITIIANQNRAMAKENKGTIYVCSELGRTPISVYQDPGEDGYIKASTTSLFFNANAQQTTFTVESNIDWSVSSTENWCTVSSNVTGLDGTVTVNVTKNTGTSARTANITLKSNAANVTVSVNQDPLQVPGGDDNPNPNYAKKR